MCLIVHRFAGSNLPNDVIDLNSKRNSDGFGIAWRDREGGLHHAKYGPQSFMKFRKQLKRLDRHPEVEYTAHFRFATTGAPCRDLSHPFSYIDEKEGEVLVFHNGVIDIDAPKGESDTSQFVKAVLAKLPSGWWREAHYSFLVESAIGGSRMLLMTATESVYINEDSWTRNGGLMYSTDPGGSHSKYKAGNGKVYTWGAYSDKGKDTTTKYLPSGSTLLTPVAKSIETSSSDLRVVDVDVFPEGDDDFDVQTWEHGGHTVESLGERIEDGEEATVEAICVECQTIGEVYIISGELFIDVPHGVPSSDDEDDEEDILLDPRWDGGAGQRGMVPLYSH